MACVFLAAVDQVCLSALHIEPFDTRGPKTIIATALPTIVSDLKGGSRYSWVGRFVVSPQILSIEVIDLPLVPICCWQPGWLSTLVVLLISLDSLAVFHLYMESCQILLVGNPYYTALLASF